MITLFNLFGEPQDLAFQHSINARDYKLACNWLRTVEALFRRLLLIEASHYAREMEQAKPRTHSKRQRREMAFFPENPDAWRVTFRTLDGGRPRPHGAVHGQSPALDRLNDAGEDARGPMRLPARFHSAWPLAERFEALLRVHNDPTPYAKRLARRLYAAPQRVACIIKEPPELQHRIDLDQHAMITTLIGARTPVFNSS